ncbi:uncharacterized protein LOC113471921 [Diaphorina citri]|uniref:Uncharacterized protein LOC113471921 n=1 Tax=Diaphorina citri TaxID=121845 RepID=A0A3Q0JJ89_DIACI|nr:uncharacterized protein LOC113471921 [Diaphorina citri]
MKEACKDAFIKISRTEGILSLWSGLAPTLLLALPATIAYFVTYEQLRVKLKDLFSPSLHEQPFWIPLISGSVARIGAVTLVSPLELVRTKMQSEKMSYFAVHLHVRPTLSSHQRVRPTDTTLLFIYMFAPLCHHIKESDLQTFRLENGLKIWQALWDYRHPEAPCFTAPCKPKPKVVWSKILKAPHHHSQFGDIFLGRKHSDGHEGFAGPSSPPSQSYYDPCSSGAGTGAKPSPSEEDGNWPISSPKDLNFPETIPEESSSVEEEHVMIYRLPSVSENDKPNRIYTAHPNSIFRMTVEKEDGYPPITKASLTIEQVASNSSDTIKSLPHHG